jgi:kynurenine 3-monooxygenase
MPMPEQPRVAIVGAGLAGCTLATLLARRGIEVTVYERREDLRRTGPERGRSINLAISARGLDALERVGLQDEALARALPMHGRMIHTGTGEQSFRPYSANRDEAINSISRGELNAVLLDVAEKTPGVTVQFGYRLREVDPGTGQLSFVTSDDHRRRPRADIVLACDGSYSAVRQSVTFRDGFTFGQDYLDAEYKELTIPARASGDFALDPDALHIWPRGDSMMIALPNLDRSFTCTLFWPHERFAALETDAQIRDHFARHYPDAAPLMPELIDDYRNNPSGSLVTITCHPWVHRGDRATVALVGDAAHAIVPFFGQGANCALEDCVEIDRCLDESGDDWARALSSYEPRRKANCDAIAEMALENFVEMRDRVNSRVFRTKTATAHALERALPGHYVSRYELVSFTTIPYAEIPDRMRRQNRVSAAVAAGAGLGAAGAAELVRRLVRSRRAGKRRRGRGGRRR